MNNQVTVKLEDELAEMLRKEAARKYSNPTATVRKCLLLTLPILLNGTPESVLEGMGGNMSGKARR